MHRVTVRLKQGIFLITTLMLIAFLTMLVTTILVTSLSGSTSTASYVNRKVAADAAVSGLNFVQSMLESNIQTLAPTPNGVAANTTITSTDGTIQVTVSGWNIVGSMVNTNTAGVGEQPLCLMFQACFNQDYNIFKARPTAPPLGTIQLPACPFVSTNNLNRLPQSGTNLSKSYTAAGGLHQSVQGQRADVIVIGYAVTPDGTILASRVVEGVFDVGQISGFAGTAGMANTGINLLAGNTITVGTNGTAPPGFYGLSSFSGNIAPQGTVPPVGGATAPPNYVSSSKVALTSGGQFQYHQGASITDYTSTDSQVGAPRPPKVNATDLPPLHNVVTIPAGTYVVWGAPAAVYHYPANYVATNGASPPAAIPVQDQNWSQPDPTRPPLLNGVAPDTGPMSALDSGNLVKFTPSPAAGVAGNSFTDTGNDIQVAPAAGVNSFTLVVAPSMTSATSANPNAPIVGSAAANGSAQLQFLPSVQGSSLQLRSAGDVNIMGNVTGTGSIQAVGSDTVSSLPADVNVLGKSTLDGRSDTGVAIYTNGQTNVFGLVDASGNTVAQLPSSISSYQTLLALNPQNVATSPPTASPSASPDPVSAWIIGQVMGQGNCNGITCTSGGSCTFGAFSSFSAIQSALNQQNNGTLTVAQVQTFWTAIGGPPLPSGGFSVATSTIASLNTNPSPSPSASGSPGPGPSGGPAVSFDQIFNGMVYAGGSFNFSTGANFTVNGMLVANSGQLNLSANNITLNYDRNLAGQFANLFSGGRVLLQRSSVTVY